MRLLTPEINFSASFPLVIDGVDNRDVCEGKGYVERLRAGVEQGGIQFEVLWPVHYWVVLYDIYKPRKIFFDHVRKVKQVGPGTLRLDMQENTRGAGWDVKGAAGATYEITIIDKGTRFEIPEIGRTFIRCAPPRPGHHRLGSVRWPRRWPRRIGALLTPRVARHAHCVALHLGHE